MPVTLCGASLPHSLPMGANASSIRSLPGRLEVSGTLGVAREKCHCLLKTAHHASLFAIDCLLACLFACFLACHCLPLLAIACYSAAAAAAAASDVDTFLLLLSMHLPAFPPCCICALRCASWSSRRLRVCAHKTMRSFAFTLACARSRLPS